MKASAPLLAALAFALATAQQRGSEPQAAVPQSAPPTIVVNVNRVAIPVVVRDKQGRTVSDLKKEDFQVFDDGKPQPISGFMVEKWIARAKSAATGEQPKKPGAENIAP